DHEFRLPLVSTKLRFHPNREFVFLYPSFVILGRGDHLPGRGSAGYF
ncbi:MAG: hypothetical protein ACI8V5_002292, partial [Limisphaerales bacterium]